MVLFRRSTLENNAATKIDTRYCYDFGHYSVRVPHVLVDVVLILYVSLTIKISVTFTIISTYSPWRQKNREARSTALQPICRITGRVVPGHHCIWSYIIVLIRLHTSGSIEQTGYLVYNTEVTPVDD